MTDHGYPDHDRQAIDRAASRWIVRLHEGPLSADEQRDLRDWRDADIRHDDTFTAMHRTWSDIAGLRELAALVPAPEAVVARAATHRRGSRSRLGWASGLAAAASAAALLWVPGNRQGPSQNYATAIAQSRRLALADGSIVTLGAKSSATVRFSDAERRVTLTGGEAFFEVVHDARRPFVVEAGTSIVRDVGTKFNVNLGDGSMRVSVLEGLVQVTHPDGAGEPWSSRLLRAGQRVEIRPASASAAGVAPMPAADIVASVPQPPGAWRAGRLVYDNVRLADLVADVNRYYAPGVQLDTKAVGDLRVTASFRTGEIPMFMAALDATLPVKAAEQQDGGFRVKSDADQARDPSSRHM